MIKVTIGWDLYLWIGSLVRLIFIYLINLNFVYSKILLLLISFNLIIQKPPFYFCFKLWEINYIVLLGFDLVPLFLQVSLGESVFILKGFDNPVRPLKIKVERSGIHRH